ncbi:MAG: DNA repair protein RadC [Rhodospirillales bacterium]|nr:DNA repair protein RadC [Rhodospirillales bacterium]
MPDPGPDPVPDPGPGGHRARLRQRLLEAGPAALADHEMLEMLLFLALPRRDTKPVARALLARFGSFAAAIAASPAALAAQPGLGEAAIAALKLAQAAALRLARAELHNRPLLDHWAAVEAYLAAALAREAVEQVRALFLDRRNHLLADEVLGTGSIDHAPVYPREVMRRALELHTSALIIVHNHPSGDPSPSAQDIAMTRELMAAAKTLGIVLHDHLIVGNGRCASLRRLGLM